MTNGKRTFKRIEHDDRLNIAAWLTQGVPVYDIAKRLNVTPPTVYREIRRGLSGERDSAGRMIYSPDYAEKTAQRNRRLSARKPRLIVGHMEDAL
jgi:IS30 family transposase